MGDEQSAAVGILRVTLALPAGTLKEKRSIVKSVVERLRNRFNATVAEIGYLDTPGRATIAAAVLAGESAHAQRQLQAIARAIEEWRLDAELIDVETEVMTL